MASSDIICGHLTPSDGIKWKFIKALCSDELLQSLKVLLQDIKKFKKLEKIMDLPNDMDRICERSLQYSCLKVIACNKSLLTELINSSIKKK